MSTVSAPPADPLAPTPVRTSGVTALWCWGGVALAFGFSRALVGLDAGGVPPAGFAAYSVLIFVVIPALPALLAAVALAAATRTAPPTWVHLGLVALAFGGWVFAASRAPLLTLAYAAAAVLAAGIVLIARSRANLGARIAVAVLGLVALGAAWYWVESLG